jgi:ADP-heptose:LPS heptosyltransferase
MKDSQSLLVHNKKILIICASGIGNTILFTPTLETLRKEIKAKITLFVTMQGFAEPISGSRLVDEIMIFDNDKSLFEKIKNIIRLRKEKFDYSITAFPSNRWQFNIFAFLVGAKKRITHSYRVDKLRTLSFLQNAKVPAVEKLHDVEQNLNLLRALNIKPKKKKRELQFYVNKENKEFANKWYKENKISNRDFLVGIHPGCKKITKYRRWSTENFVKIINNLIKLKKKILLFTGPDEIEDVTWIYNQYKEKGKIFLIKEKSLKHAAALIAKCRMFICTDSGLGHIAAASKVPTLAIFGPAQPSRTRPYGKYGHYISSDLPCSPCLKYPFQSSSNKIKCKKNYKCLTNITVDLVMEKINKI